MIVHAAIIIQFKYLNIIPYYELNSSSLLISMLVAPNEA